MKKIILLISNVANWNWKWFLFVKDIYTYLLEKEPEALKEWIMAYCSSILGVLDRVKKWDYTYYKNLKEVLIKQLNEK